MRTRKPPWRKSASGQATRISARSCCSAVPPRALGRRRYWPIYEEAVAHGLPIGIHVFGYSGWPVTNTGWASYYIEEMSEHGTACSALIASMIFEGLFDAMPELKVVMIEAGFAWIPALGWRMDKTWERLKGEVPACEAAALQLSARELLGHQPADGRARDARPAQTTSSTGSATTG